MSTTPPAPSPPPAPPPPPPAPPPAPLADFSRDIPPEQSLIEYPCAFPIKVMGLQVDGFVEAVLAVARHFDPDLDPATIERRPSSSGKYLGLTITVNATSRVQLDELYRNLSSHPMVKVVL